VNPTNLHMYALAAPLIGAFVVMIAGRYSRRAVAPLVLGVLSFSLAAALAVFLQVLSGGGFRYVVGNWLAPYGIELSVDRLGSLMQVLVSGVALTASVSAVKSVARDLEDRQHLFFTLYLILIAGLHGLVLTADAFNVYVLLEIASITAYGLIALGRGRAVVSSFNYVIMGSTGACFYLLGIGYLYILTGTLNMADLARIIPTLESGPALATAFSFCIVGLWIKMAFFPLHVWLPNAYSDMPDGAAVLVAPLMTKVTIYLMIRVMFSIFSPAYEFIQHGGVQQIVVGVAALGIVCASAMALGQKDLRRMLTYLIVAEVGYMVGGVWLANAQGMTGAILHIVNDALMTLCLFLAVSAIASRAESLDFDRLRGLFRRMPVTMAALVVAALSMIGVPPTCGFFSKWYLLLGGIEAGQWLYVGALIFSSLVNAVLFFRVIEIAYFRMSEGDANVEGPAAEPVREEAPAMMLQPLVAAAAALIAVGLVTGPLVQNVIRFALPAGM
jgi:multicomponent Na+:H+ antiporter subunit D